MADCAEVHANLMRPAGGDRHAQQRCTVEVLRKRDARVGIPGSARACRHLLPVAGISADWLINATPGVHEAPDKRDVFLFHFSIAELARELLVRRIILGDHHQS